MLGAMAAPTRVPIPALLFAVERCLVVLPEGVARLPASGVRLEIRARSDGRTSWILVASDGIRIVRCELHAEEGETIAGRAIARNDLAALRALLAATEGVAGVRITSDELSLRSGALSFQCELSTPTIPAFDDLFSAEPVAAAEVPRRDLVAALERVLLLDPEARSPVHLRAIPGHCFVSRDGAETVTTDIAARTIGQPVQLRLDPARLVEILRSFTTRWVRLSVPPGLGRVLVQGIRGVVARHRVVMLAEAPSPRALWGV